MPPPQLGVVASPVTGGGTRSAAGEDLAQAAEALKGFNPTLQQYAIKQAAKNEEEATTKGKFDAFKSATTYRDAVNAGTLEQGENPFFRKARKEQIGRNTGYAIAGIVEQEYSKWEGRNSEDLDGTAAQEFVSGIIATHTKDIEDPQVVAGLEPILQQSVSNFLQKVRSDAVKELEEGYRAGVSETLGLALADLNSKGQLTAENWNALLDEQRAEANLLAIGNSEFDELVFEAVSNRSLLSLDASLLNLLDIPRSDGTPAMSAKPAFQKKIADARDGTFRNEWQVNSRSATAEANIKEAAKDVLEKEVLIAVYGTVDQPPTGMTPELREKVNTTLGFQLGATFLNAVEGATDNSDLSGFDSEEDLDRANAAVISGDRAFIQQMIFEKRIPTKQRLYYLNQVDSQIAQFASTGRAEASAERAAEPSATELAAKAKAEKQAALVEAARIRASGGTDPQTTERTARLEKIKTAHPQLYTDFSASGVLPVIAAYKAASAEVGPAEARKLFDEKYGPGASKLLQPQD